MKERKWKDVIIAWANGSEVEYRRHECDAWEALTEPFFDSPGYYQVKPAWQPTDGEWYLVRWVGSNKVSTTPFIAEYNEEYHRAVIFGDWFNWDSVEVLGTVAVTLLKDKEDALRED